MPRLATDSGAAGVWALAAVARLESNFGRGMDQRELQSTGPLGLEPSEWSRYAVDGDGDGRIRHADPADSAATLARLIWARGRPPRRPLRPQPGRVVRAGGARRSRPMQGRCKVTYTDWSIALPAAAGGYVDPFSLSTNLVTGRVDQGVDFTGDGTDRRDRGRQDHLHRCPRLARRRWCPLPATRRPAQGPADLRLLRESTRPCEPGRR